MMFPLMLSTSGIITAIVTLQICKLIYKIDNKPGPSVERGLKGILIVSTVLQQLVTILVAQILPGGYFNTAMASFKVDAAHTITAKVCVICVSCGLWSGLAIGLVTEYYTSHSYRPVREVAESQKTSAATGIIFGLALGYMSCIVPTVLIGLSVCISHLLAGMYGVSLAALGMLGTLACCLTIDVYGPISDNAGGIAEMAGFEEDVREKTDCLDAAGNTTAAVGKGFAIGSAALVSLALFGAFTVRAGVGVVDIMNPWTFLGLLFGAMVPYWFSAMTMKSVGIAAQDMVEECMLQFKEIMENGAEPDYQKCIKISTEASLREMIAPGALVILTPIVMGTVFGKNACAGVLSGALVSGVQLAVSMSNPS